MQRKYGIKLASILLVSCVLFMPHFSPAIGQASRLKQQINQQLKQLDGSMRAAKKEQQKAEAAITAAEQLVVKARREVTHLQSAIHKKSSELVAISGQIDTSEWKLEDAKHQLQQVNERLVQRGKLLDTRVRLMYTDGFVSYIDVLFSATSFSDFLDRIDMLQAIAERDKEIWVEHQRDKQLVVQKKQEIEAELQRVKILYDQLKVTKRELLKKEHEKQGIITRNKLRIEDSSEASEEQARLLMQFAQQRADLLRKRAILNQPKKKTAVYAYSGGKLGVPLADSYRITSPFGTRVDPITGAHGAFHEGIDMAVAKGTPIYAAEGGVVIIAEWYSGYGNCIIIDHGSGLWTLYGHIRSGGIQVNKGDIVKRGAPIAEVGMTGRATGYHLHFEVRVNGNRVNPANYFK